MNPSEVQEMLLEASAFDGRLVTDEVVDAWHRILQDMRMDQAMAAMRAHFASSDRRLMPVHIVQGVKKIRTELMRDYQGPGGSPEIPSTDPDDVMKYLAEGVERRIRAGDGERSPRLALVRGVGQMPPELRETTPLVVPCRACGQPLGRKCQSATKRPREPHIERVLDFEEWKRRNGREAG